MLQMLTGDTLFPSQDIEEDLQEEILNMDLDFPDFLEKNEVEDYKLFVLTPTGTQGFHIMSVCVSVRVQWGFSKSLSL